MDLATWMDGEGETILGLAKRVGVGWRTVRDARASKLSSANKAKQIADAIGLDGDGAYLVDPASMLDLDPPPAEHHEAAE